MVKGWHPPSTKFFVWFKRFWRFQLIPGTELRLGIGPSDKSQQQEGSCAPTSHHLPTSFTLSAVLSAVLGSWDYQFSMGQGVQGAPQRVHGWAMPLLFITAATSSSFLANASPGNGNQIPFIQAQTIKKLCFTQMQLRSESGHKEGRGLVMACLDFVQESKTHCPEQSKINCPEQSKTHCPEQSRTHCPEQPQIHFPEQHQIHFPEHSRTHFPEQSSNS